MKVIKNECCDCAVPDYPCIGDRCPNRNVVHYHCDECEIEGTLYHYDGEHLCADCLLGRFPIVEGSDY